MKKFSLIKKVIFLLGLSIIGSVAISTNDQLRFKQLNDTLSNIVWVTSKRVGLAKDMRASLYKLWSQELALETASGDDARKKGVDTIKKSLEEVESEISDFDKLVTADVKTEFEELKGNLTKFNTAAKDFGGAITAQKPEATKSTKDVLVKTFDTLNKNIDDLADKNEKSMMRETVMSDDNYSRNVKISLFLTGAIILICSIMAFIFLRPISKAMSEIIANLRGEAGNMANSSVEVNTVACSLAETSTEEATSLQKTAVSLEEINAMVSRTAQNATRSVEVSSLSFAAANKGKAAVDKMRDAIQEISESNREIMTQIEDSNRQISEIVKVIGEIRDKTNVINDIVFQTKLLSFNASVEAARAGEHGKGFAVVAEEVGNLAQMSGNAAKEIADMLNSSIQKVEGIVSHTKQRVERLISDGVRKVESGKEIAVQCGEVLDEVVKNANEVNGLVGEITTATQEQSEGVNEITRAMNQLDQASSHVVKAAGQVKDAAEHLMKESTVLDGAVDRLEVTVKGGKPNWTPPPVAPKRPTSNDAGSGSGGPTNNVVAFPKSKKASPPPAPVETAPSVQTAPGAMVENVPSEDDPRFQEI